MICFAARCRFSFSAKSSSLFCCCRQFYFAAESSNLILCACGFELCTEFLLVVNCFAAEAGSLFWLPWKEFAAVCRFLLLLNAVVYFATVCRFYFAADGRSLL